MEFSWLSWLIGGILGVITGQILYRVFYRSDNSGDNGEIIIVNCSGLIENPDTQNMSTQNLYLQIWLIPAIGIDSNEEYCEIASKRCKNTKR